VSKRGVRGNVAGSNFEGSMVRAVHEVGKNVGARGSSTSVLPSRNLRAIGQPDRWWQNCSVEEGRRSLGVSNDEGVRASASSLDFVDGKMLVKK
jgi:hypothetical protein